MMVSHVTAPTMEGLREASERWARRERARVRLVSGTAVLDALLGGGWPQGKVGELVGPASSGRSGVAVATVAAATARGEVVAWLDAADAFDPASVAAAGVDLRRVLWVRTRGVEESVRAVELVLETGGFTVVVLDFGSGAHGVMGVGAVLATARGWAGERGGASTGGGKPRPCDGAVTVRVETDLAGARRRRRERGGALRLRLARAVERAGAVALVLAGRPWAGTLAGVTVVLGRGTVRWGGERSRWLDGIALQARVQRGGVRGGARHDLNVGAGLVPVRQGRREQRALGA